MLQIVYLFKIAINLKLKIIYKYILEGDKIAKAESEQLITPPK